MDENFQIIEYADIDLEGTESLLKTQGLLKVELGWLRARTFMALLNQEEKFKSRSYLRKFLVWRLLAAVWDIFRLVPLTLMSSKIVELHCIFVNHCSRWEWERLPNGQYRFTLA